MYAIVNISGKQFKVAEGKYLMVPKQVGKVGEKIKFDHVLLISDDKNVKIGNPTLSGVSIQAEILSHERSKKILVFKKKRRKGYQRKNGHRQWHTKIRLEKITISNKNLDIPLDANPEKVPEQASSEEE